MKISNIVVYIVFLLIGTLAIYGAVNSAKECQVYPASECPACVCPTLECNETDPFVEIERRIEDGRTAKILIERMID